MNEKKTNIVRLALILILIAIPNLAMTPSKKVVYLQESKVTINIKEKKMYDEWNKAYNNLVDSIKLHEKYMSEPYKCPSGQLTVGYGHAIKVTDHFKYPMSEKTADSLLKSDLNVALEYVKKTTPLKHKQLLAMGHFVFCLGSGNFNKSNLKKVILDKKPIDDELMRWVHIQTSRGKVTSTFLKRIRQMELELFKS
jgi:GH24 family phage-related lysozyme (muramidase)